MEQGSNNFNVNGFLQQLQNAQPKEKGDGMNARKLDQIHLSFNGNHGKYQILPMTSTITGYPYVDLKQTREIKLPFKNHNKVDGTDREFTSWIKLLPKTAYQMVDSTGRIVSSLTREDEELLTQAYTTFDRLYELLGGKQKDQNLNKAIGFLRKRDYTLFNGKCLGKWSMTDPRTPERTNFAALFVCTAKGFMQSVSDNINDETLAAGGSTDWISQVYSRQLTGRTGFLIFSINMNQGGKIGYSTTISHKYGINNPEINNHVITDEEAELMTDPVEAFLGWQAGKEPGRLFNKSIIEEAIARMSAQIQAVQMAISTNTDVVQAMQATSQLALKQSAPVGGADAVNEVYVNQANVMNNNVDPFNNPPAAHIDPVTQRPIDNGFAGSQPAFTKPAFAESNPAATPFGMGNSFGSTDPFRQ
jgi:hypothetical protein